MPLITPNTLWLTKAKYVEKKRAIVLWFSNSEKQLSKIFPLFPEMHLPKEIADKKELLEFFSASHPQRFRVIEEKNSFRILTSTFSEMLEIAEAFSKKFSFSPAIIEPERQFLIQKNWSYFDAFEISAEETKKLALLSLPDTKLDSLAESLPFTVKQLFPEKKKTAIALLQKIVLSNTIRLPIGHVSLHSNPEATFLENLLFANRFSNYFEGKGFKETPRQNFSQGFSTIIDFSELWAELLTNSFYNIGFETIDCECCKPNSVLGKNVLLHSIVEVEFFSDGFFFDSMLSSFALEFHEKNNGKESREKRKREFFLPEMPVGPFYRGRRTGVPLVDAIELSKAGDCRIVHERELHWFCEKQESFVSSAVKELKEKIALLESSLSQMDLHYRKSFGLFYYNNLSLDPEFVFLREFKKSLSNILHTLPILLTNTTKFFYKKTSHAALALQQISTQKFKRFSRENGCRHVIVSKEKAFVSAVSALDLLSGFSKKEAIPSPIIVREKRLRTFG